MNHAIEELREWGCDIQGAMERMLNDEEFYMECLKTVLQDSYFMELKRALGEQDIEQAFVAAHPLKGVLANLGLTPMLNKAVEIVEPLRAGNGDNLMEKCDELIEMRDHLEKILS